MTKVTNATKAAILAAITTVIQILFASGVIGSSLDAKITITVGILGGGIAWFTRKLSPKWNAVVTTVAQDVTEVAPVAAAVAETAVGKKPTKKPVAKKT